MRITRHQLRRIIREEKNRLLLEQPTQEAIIGILSGVFMGGRELAASAMADRPDLFGTENDVFTILDEMLEDGTVIFDVEEDEWSLS